MNSIETHLQAPRRRDVFTASRAIGRSALLIGFSLLGLAACSILPESEPVQLLDPRPAPSDSAGGPVGWSLSIARPETDPVRDSNRVLVRIPDGRLQVHADLRWVAPGPELLRTLALRQLRDAGTLGRVESGAARAQRQLRTDLRRFELEEGASGELDAVLVYEARLYESTTLELIARRVISDRAPAASIEAPDVLAAFEAVLSGSLAELAAWLAEQPSPPDSG